MTFARRLALVIDNRPDARLCSLLASNGFEVATCPWGLPALAAAARFQPEIIVNVVRTPWREEQEVLARVLETAPAPSICTLFAAGRRPGASAGAA